MGTDAASATSISVGDASELALLFPTTAPTTNATFAAAVWPNNKPTGVNSGFYPMETLNTAGTSWAPTSFPIIVGAWLTVPIGSAGLVKLIGTQVITGITAMIKA
jgi:hypothetical protein